MSLILDALKKAELEQKSATGRLLSNTNPIISNQTPPNKKRTLILAGLVVLSLAVFGTLRFVKKPSGNTVPQPKIGLPMQPSAENPIQLKMKATELYKENRLEESLVIWQKLTLLLPTEAEVYNNLGLVAKKLGKKEEAYQAYNRALALNKDYPEALNNLGVLLLSDGAKEQAKTDFQKAISLSKDYADPQFNLALFFEQEGNIKQAMQYYKSFLDLSPELDGALKKKIEDKIMRLGKQ